MPFGYLNGIQGKAVVLSATFGTSISLLAGRAVGSRLIDHPRLARLTGMAVAACGAMLALQTF
jgi:hypothetical protein